MHYNARVWRVLMRYHTTLNFKPKTEDQFCFSLTNCVIQIMSQILVDEVNVLMSANDQVKLICAFKNNIMEKLHQYDYNKKIEKLAKKETDKEKLKLLYTWVKTKVICFSDFESLIFYCS